MAIKVQSVENKAEEEAAATVLAQKVIEKKKYGAFKGILNDPDLKFDKKDVDNLEKAKLTLPEPYKMIKGNKNYLMCNNKGLITLKIEKKLRKTDFAKQKDKEIPVKLELIAKIDE